ncbi:sulfatase-like hydrolase/transferase [Parasphingorhabdus halotolerans]|uniref:Sulfatase-like hydrolase/transferase n=1 Tax=Parasphingorhabdus halotolerans TaxID=2725558 RepID=A0A6H2DPW4_9SPHN|nr:sulfatase-like hydrolase/transferase [Parasphingorhabdus halotolerans]
MPLFVVPERQGQSAAGTYGDVVESLDRDVAQLVEALSRTGTLENAIIIISSDNGPWYEGSAGFVASAKFKPGHLTVFPMLLWPSSISMVRRLPSAV